MTSFHYERGSGLTFVNAQFGPGGIGGAGGAGIGSVRIVGAHIVALSAAPQRGDRVVDLEGDRLLPGLINAHDHLHLNNMPRLDPGDRFEHARDWTSKIDARRHSDVAFAASVAVARDDRLLLGGMKNLLSGVTTVAHHDPLYPFLSSPTFPTQVLQAYGWSHSLYVDDEETVRESYRRTPPTWPWIIHAAEGRDESAHHEFERLDVLGCLGPNTLLVHGVALDREQHARLKQAGAGLIWCPSSNLSMFGKTADISDLTQDACVALGTDSRLSGARDLLDELRIAGELSGLDEAHLLALATRNAARLLRLTDRGSLRAGARADILILPARTSIMAARRADVRLVMIGGAVRCGDEDCAGATEPGSQWSSIRVDGRPKVLDTTLAALLRRAGARETGLELPDAAGRAA